MLFYEKGESYQTKGKVWSGIKTFWTIQNNYPVISSINKLNKRKAAKSMSTFDFSTLCTKIPHDKLLYVLNTNYGVARKFVNIFRFTDDLIGINDGNKFENHYNEICPPKLILEKENTLHTETAFLDLHLCMNEGQI